MKGILIIFAATLVLLFASCSENGTSSNQPTTSQKELIKLPPKASLSTELQISASDKIDGAVGGQIILSSTYISLEGKIVSINAILSIPAGAFDGSRNISATADDDYAAIYFYPHMTFDKPLKLTLSFTGLDLKDMNLANGVVGFYYVDNQGNMTPVYNKGVIVNNLLGSITVMNAQIDHFSRYAFGK